MQLMAKILIFKIRRDNEIFLWAQRLWVGRLYEPKALGYISKFDGKKNSGIDGLMRDDAAFGRHSLIFSSNRLL